jgi:hypothetical protein
MSMKTMTQEEALVAGKISLMLTEGDPLEDGEAEVHFTDARAPGMLRVSASCSARVLSPDAELQGLYEVTVSVRRIA